MLLRTAQNSSSLSRIIFLSTCLLLQGTSAALANQIFITPATDTSAASIKASELKVLSIGPIRLPNGSISLNGNRLDVYAVPDWLFDQHLVLSGIALDSRVEAAAGQSNITGLALFTGGDWLTNLGPKLALDTFTLREGRVVRGNVLGTTSDTIQVQTPTGQRETFRISDIQTISSVRAFKFSIGSAGLKLEPSTNQWAAEADSMSFLSTNRSYSTRTVAAKIPKSNLPGTEGGISNAKLATFVALDLIHDLSPAVIAPLVFTTPNLRTKQLLQQANDNSSPSSSSSSSSSSSP